MSEAGDQKAQAAEKVRMKSAALRGVMIANGINAHDLRAYADMFIAEAEVIRLQWIKDKN